MKKGIVYILTNPCMPDWVKIGQTEREDIQDRIQELNQPTNLPLSFRPHLLFYVDNPKEVEKHIHNLFDHIDSDLHAIEKLDNGKERKREFFKISKEKAELVLREVAALLGKSDNIKSPELTIEEQKIEEMITKRRGRITFSELNIPIGSELVFLKDPTIKCTTINDKNRVKFQDKEYTLSGLSDELLGYSSSGPAYFVFDNETLWDRRLKMESEQE